MTKYLITPTLLNSYDYYIQDEFKSPANSRADFLKTLSRGKFEPNQAMQKGIDFENDVLDACNNKLEADYSKIEPRFVKSVIDSEAMSTKEISNWIIMREYIDCVENVAKIVNRGLWQESVKKDLQIGNQEFLLYGKTDVIKRDTVYDIKYTSNYELGKFLNSAQHLIYLYCTGLPKFKYLISNGKDFWQEDYFNNGNIENEIKSKINDFLSYLENDSEAKNLFETKWQAKYD